MSPTRKQEVISFKVDEALSKALDGVPNRSEFIRTAILAALQSTCPLCCGTGILTPQQQKHWQDFAQNHPLKKCAECHSLHLVCVAGSQSGKEEAPFDAQP
ncbi:MAG TPA: CopG family transcriptional regulator [Firmicutes bacterium]|nr:CopG family transcriptional regulator [Bacillota bacterium]HHW11813.1 CopG family transcriptional regulator [Bacillota bacterium]